MDDASDADARYWAFVSYSHRDAGAGRWLHRRLESYVLPRRLVGRTTAQGVAPGRLRPIFRDREELPAADDLTAEVRAALAASRTLVVVCSPHAAASPWVAREIETFRQLHPGRPILAALVEGEPADAFPAALRRSPAGDMLREPLAADLRPEGDGRRLGLLKLVAGVVGLGLDELVQRDAQRRLQRVTAVTAGSLVVTLAMVAMTAFALLAQREADRQRSEVEGLIEFMRTDLRETLKGVGRLDAMTATNERALKYYGEPERPGLPAPSRLRRARLLHAMGEDADTLGDRKTALVRFREAHRTTSALLAEAPRDPERIYAHAQSEFWIAFADYRDHRFDAARSGFAAYKRLADRLVQVAPSEARSFQEAAYAEGNLCTLDLKSPRSARAAIGSCQASLERMQHAARLMGGGDALAGDIANRHAWLADAYRDSGDLRRARSERLEQERILGRLMAADPRNMDLKDMWVTCQQGLAGLEGRAGDRRSAIGRTEKAIIVLEGMIGLDPANKTWAARLARARTELAALKASQATEREPSYTAQIKENRQ